MSLFTTFANLIGPSYIFCFVIEQHIFLIQNKSINNSNKYIQSYYYHLVIHHPRKNISAKFFQMKASTGRKFIYYQEKSLQIAFSVIFNTKYFITYYIRLTWFFFCKIKAPLCSFCHSYDEAIKHVFLECICVEELWNNLKLFLTNDISLPILMPQATIFGFINGIENSVYTITNHKL